MKYSFSSPLAWDFLQVEHSNFQGQDLFWFVGPSAVGKTTLAKYLDNKKVRVIDLDAHGSREYAEVDGVISKSWHADAIFGKVIAGDIIVGVVSDPARFLSAAEQAGFRVSIFFIFLEPEFALKARAARNKEATFDAYEKDVVGTLSRIASAVRGTNHLYKGAFVRGELPGVTTASDGQLVNFTTVDLPNYYSLHDIPVVPSRNSLVEPPIIINSDVLSGGIDLDGASGESGRKRFKQLRITGQGGHCDYSYGVLDPYILQFPEDVYSADAHLFVRHIVRGGFVSVWPKRLFSHSHSTINFCDDYLPFVDPRDPRRYYQIDVAAFRDSLSSAKTYQIGRCDYYARINEVLKTIFKRCDPTDFFPSLNAATWK